MEGKAFSRKKKQLLPHKVINIQQVGSNAYTIDISKSHFFMPGQIIAIALNADSDEPRLYSIASGTNEKHYRILFDINPKGEITPKLAHLNIGDEIFISEPFGKFIGTAEPAYWIGTGTGIAPFISMCLSGIHHNKTLLHGSRTLSNFYFQDLFSAEMKDRYLRFCTQEKSPDVIEGRLTEYLKASKELPKSIKYYLCGSAEMIINVREILVEQKGIPYENIISEIYF